jgi:diguanylate cyclase (GGDEF)-like protein
VTSPGARNRSYRLLMAALLATTAADVIWNVMVTLSGDSATEIRWLNAGWLLAYVLVAAATNSPAMALVAEPAPPSDMPPLGRRRVVAMGVGQLLPAIALTIDGLVDDVVDWPVIAIGGAILTVLVLARFVDLLSLAQTQAVQLAALARTDALTGAPNRRTWDHELSRACKLARDRNTPLSAAILDLDHFKAYNDSHGHQAGDELLREAVAAWRESLPADTTLARYGGEEFAVLLPGYHLDQAETVITTLTTRTPRGQTFSAGVAEWRSTDNPTALVAAADQALYSAKRAGRNRVATAPGHVAARPLYPSGA